MSLLSADNMFNHGCVLAAKVCLAVLWNTEMDRIWWAGEAFAVYILRQRFLKHVSPF